MNYLAALTFQIPIDLAVKESSFLEIQEFRELFYTKCSFKEEGKFCILKYFLKTPHFVTRHLFPNLSRKITWFFFCNSPALFLKQTNLCNFDKTVHSEVLFMLLTQHG